jgi:hypothetical protein
MNLKNRKGIVKVRKELFNDALDDFPKVLELIFGKFYCIHIDNNPFDYYMLYNGYSSEFREISEGDKIPNYDIIVTRITELRKNSYSIEFREII